VKFGGVGTLRDMDLRSIGQCIRDQRQALGLRQSDVAERAGVSRSHIAQIESGARFGTIDTLQQVLDVLGLVVQVEPEGGSAEFRNAFDLLSKTEQQQLQRLLRAFPHMDEAMRIGIAGFADTVLSRRVIEPDEAAG
jgi:transcriptional regulator with XRE-family HTH domain